MYMYSRSSSDSSVMIIVFAIVALILAILSVILITPRSRKPYLNGFFTWLHHVFNFDALLIDKILKFLYIFSTFFVIFEGFAILIMGSAIGLLVMLIGPFLIRLFYEMIMMMVILVKHVAEINRKVKNENPGAPAEDLSTAPAEPYAPAAPVTRAAPRPVAPVCPACGSKMKPGAKFCGVCGYHVESAPAPAPDRNNYYPTDSDL